MNKRHATPSGSNIRNENVQSHLMTFLCFPSLSGKKGYHFYFNSSNFREILECVLELGNKHSRNAMTVLSTKGKTIGHVPEALAKILTPEMVKETTLSLKAEVTG